MGKKKEKEGESERDKEQKKEGVIEVEQRRAILKYIEMYDLEN